MKNELISIIVPAYNVEAYIQKTIKSLLRQTYQNIEIICVDDGSKDGTLQAITTMAALDSRVKVFSKQNEGVTKARQFGFERSNGEYIGFTDADDEVDPTMFERLYNNLKKYDTDISHCGYVIDNTDGTHEYFYNTGCLEQQDKISGVKSLISGSFEPGLWNKLYKRNLLLSLFNSGVMDFSIKMNEDVLMNYYLFKEANSSVLEDVCLYHYVKREGSATMSEFSRKYTWDKLNVKQIIRDDSIGSEYEDVAREAYILKCIHSYNVFLKQDNREYDDDLKQIRKLLMDNKADIRLLKKKYKLLANTIKSSPAIYAKIFKSFS